MRSSSVRGFTLIELLVVIAIIGVLSSIVISSLNTARNKGNDAAIKSNLDQARTVGELFYDSNGNHYVVTAGSATDVCDPTGQVNGVKGVYQSFAAAAQAGGVTGANIRTLLTSTVDSPPFTKATCHVCAAGQSGTTCQSLSTDVWAAEVPLKSTAGAQLWCVDSLGFVGTTSTSLGASDAKCG